MHTAHLRVFLSAHSPTAERAEPSASIPAAPSTPPPSHHHHYHHLIYTYTYRYTYTYTYTHTINIHIHIHSICMYIHGSLLTLGFRVRPEALIHHHRATEILLARGFKHGFIYIYIYMHIMVY
jgi:hypothetical protein